MKKLASIFLALFLILGAITIAPAPAQAARVYVGVGVGGYYPGYYPGWGYPYPYYPYPYYAAPPPVVYAVPPAPPPVVVTTAPTAYQAVAPAPIQSPGLTANQTSPTFIDSYGRTCRQFQSTSGGAAFGTACLQPDGSWRSVP